MKGERNGEEMIGMEGMMIGRKCRNKWRINGREDEEMKEKKKGKKYNEMEEMKRGRERITTGRVKVWTGGGMSGK